MPRKPPVKGYTVILNLRVGQDCTKVTFEHVSLAIEHPRAWGEALADSMHYRLVGRGGVVVKKEV